MVRPSAPLQTLTDAELAGRGTALVAQYNAMIAGQSKRVPTGTLQATAPRSESMILKDLQERNPEHLGTYWEECEALYRGGHQLLCNDGVMRRLFPPHNAEMPSIYEDRRRRAFFIPYPGAIIDSLTSSLEGDPLRLVADDTSGDDADGTDLGEVPPWWAGWSKRVTAEGAALEHTHDLHGFVCEAIRAAQVKQSAWILADIPAVDPLAAEAAAQDSLQAQESLGLRDPYLCLVDASEVVDWDQDDDGTLRFVWRYTTSRRRLNPLARRGATVHTWTLYDADGWARYEAIEEDGKPMQPETAVSLVAAAPHPFGVVPWIRFTLPSGLWTMGQLKSLATEHFNKRCALSWAEYKSLFSLLYEFLAAPQQPGGGAVRTIGGGVDDPNRAINQLRGQGWTQRRGKDDRAEYVGPDVAPFKEARESCSELMQEMHRVTRTMAASANMDSKALQRSADSKADDRTDEEKVLQSFGLRGRRLAGALMDLVAAGRNESRPEGVRAKGLESFDVEDVHSTIQMLTELFAGIPMVSATAKRSLLVRLYTRLMAIGDEASPEEIKEMQREVREMVSQEDIALGMAPMPELPARAAPAPAAAEDEDDEEGDELTRTIDARGPARKVAPAPSGRRTLYSSG